MSPILCSDSGWNFFLSWLELSQMGGFEGTTGAPHDVASAQFGAMTTNAALTNEVTHAVGLGATQQGTCVLFLVCIWTSASSRQARGVEREGALTRFPETLLLARW